MAKNGSKIGSFVSLLMLIAVSFNTANVAAQDEPVVRISDEILFYDHFPYEYPLDDKWDCYIFPGTNKCEKTTNHLIGSHWNSWFLEDDGNLHIESAQTPTGKAYAESLDFTTTQDYVITIHFRLKSYSHEFKVVDNGAVLLTIEDGNDLYAHDSTNRYRVVDNIPYDTQWLLIEIRVHITTQDYDVYIGRGWEGTFDFYSSVHQNFLLLGDDSDDPAVYGAGYWDNIIVADLHPSPWSDDFDDHNILDWTTVTIPNAIFDISSEEYHSPPYSLRMFEPGKIAYGFSPYFDMVRNHDYITQFYFRIPSNYSRNATVVADGNLRIILIGTRLNAYVSDTDIRPITSISLDTWYEIRVEVHPVSSTYDVTINGFYWGTYPFVEKSEIEFVRASSQIFAGEFRQPYTGTEAFWDDMGVVSTNHPPTLTDGRVDPASGYVCITEFNYTVTYWDIDNDPPKTGYPVVNILQGGTPIGSSFVMKEVNPYDITYWDGKFYYILIRLSAVSPPDYSFYFEAYDIWDEYARDPVAPPDYSGPTVSIYTSEPWSMFHHDATHLGYTTSIAPDSAYICWISYLGVGSGDAVSPSGVLSAAVKDGKVYFVTNNNVLFALDSVTGAFQWYYYFSDLVKYNSLQPSPAVGYGRVYVGEYYGRFSPLLYDPHRVFAINVDGTLNWVKDGLFRVSSALTVADGRVFVPTIGTLWALDAYTGVEDWSYSQDVHGHLSSPVFKNGIVYVADEEGYIHAVWASGPSKGTQAGLYDRVCDTHASVTVADKIYIGEEGPCPGQPGTGYRLNAIELSIPLRLAWTFTTNGAIKSTAAVANGKVYVLNDMGRLYAIGINGVYAWDQYVGPGKSSPAVADGLVYVGDGYNDRLVALDADTGDFIWTYDSLPVGASSPAIADGMVYLPVPYSDLYAFG